MAYYDMASTIQQSLCTEHCASARRSFSTLAGAKGTVEGDAVLSFLRRFCEENAPVAEVAAVGAAIAARARARGIHDVSFPVEPGGYCLPRHLVLFEPSSLELSGTA
jgi:hypothetical protein